MQDSIVARDLGRFPDDNVADSLSHITGITIQRTRGGEGQFVNVRGLGPEFSIVTLNGRIMATDGDGREFAFDVLPSEVISGADVFKSSEAPNLEGSIGGAIDLRSARPLDGIGDRFSLTAEVDYNDLSEDNGYKVSGVFNRTFMDGQMGLLVTAVYQDTEVRSDAVHEFYINPDSPGEFDADGDGEISDDESGLLGLCCTSIGARIQQKERSGVTATWQWDVNDSFRMTVDGLFTRLDAPTVGYHQSFYVEDSILDEGDGPAPLERRQHHRPLGGRHDSRRARPGDLDHHRVPRRRHDAVRLERQLGRIRPPAFLVRRLHVAGGARFRRQGHLGRIGHRRKPRRTRRHEPERAFPTSASRSTTGATSRPRSRTASSATRTSDCTTSACRAPT